MQAGSRTIKYAALFLLSVLCTYLTSYFIRCHQYDVVFLLILTNYIKPAQPPISHLQKRKNKASPETPFSQALSIKRSKKDSTKQKPKENQQKLPMIPCLFSPINLAKAPPSILQRSHLFLSKDIDLLPCLSMDSFSLPKLWKPPTAAFGDSLSVSAADRCLVSVVEAVEEEEESFFELELTLPDYDDRVGCNDGPVGEKIGRIGDFISGEKPDPRIRSKPQSPMSILKQSAPKLRIFMFGKPIKRSKPEKSSSQPQSVSSGCRRKTRINFTVKLRFEDGAASKKKLCRSESSKSNSNGGGGRDLDGFCRKFSKDSVNKYLNLIKKPLYVKLSNTISNSKQRESFDSGSTASFSSPRKSEERTSFNGRFGAPVKSLGKSRSAGALLVGASFSSSSDDSLAQQNDGIQGAILHCKQSFNSSTKERRMMSRCASDTSNEKSY